MKRLIGPGNGSILRFQRWQNPDFSLSASNIKNLKIQGFEQTLIQEGGGLEVWRTHTLYFDSNNVSRWMSGL